MGSHPPRISMTSEALCALRDLVRWGASASNAHSQPTLSLRDLVQGPWFSLDLCVIFEAVTATAPSHSDHTPWRTPNRCGQLFPSVFWMPAKVTDERQSPMPAKARCDRITLAKFPADQPLMWNCTQSTCPNLRLFGLLTAPLTPTVM